MTECAVGHRCSFSSRLHRRHTLAPSRRISPELCFVASPSMKGRREDREPVGSHQPPCQEQIAYASCTAGNRATGDIPAFPAQWSYGLCRDLPGERCTIAPVALRMTDGANPVGPQRHRKSWRTDPGRQDHTILPYADGTGRMRDDLAHGLPPCKPVRANAICVHRRPARVRDDRDTPLFLGPGCGDTYAVSEFR